MNWDTPDVSNPIVVETRRVEVTDRLAHRHMMVSIPGFEILESMIPVEDMLRQRIGKLTPGCLGCEQLSVKSGRSAMSDTIVARVGCIGRRMGNLICCPDGKMLETAEDDKVFSIETTQKMASPFKPNENYAYTVKAERKSADLPATTSGDW